MAGPYMVVVLAGDSNSCHGKYADEAGIDQAGSGIFQFKHNETIVAANEPLDTSGTSLNYDGTGHGAVGSTVALCRLLRDRGKVPAGYSILIVPTAWEGTAFLNFWATTGFRYALDGGYGGVTNGFYNMVNKAMATHASNRLWFFDWNHGANDGGQTQAQYQNNMIATWGEIRSTIPGATNVPIIAPGIPPNHVNPAYGASTNFVGVIAAQRNIANILSRAVYVNCEDITMIDSSDNYIHYPAAAHRGGTNNAPGNVGEVVTTNNIAERKYTALLGLLNVGILSFAAGTAGTTWRQVKIGGGGYVTGIDRSTDGTTIVARNDTYCGHVWNSTTGVWEELATYNSLPAMFREPEAYTGCTELRVAPSNPNRLYMMWTGKTFRSDNRGGTWVDLNRDWGALNDPTGQSAVRFMGQKMAVDPINPDVVYQGTPSDGVWVTFDAGANWAKISTSSIPVCSTAYGGMYPGHPGICFDPTSGTTGGRTNTIYIPVYGGSIYRSTNAGSTWASITSPLAKVHHAKVNSNGNYWIAGMTASEASSELYKWNGTAWSANLSAAGAFADAVDSMVFDPADANRVVAFGSSGNPRLSTNGGTSFGAQISFTRTSADIPWLAYTEESYMSMGDVIWVGSNEIWIAGGIGVAKCTFSGSPSSIVWDYVTKGIENLTVNQVTCPPNGNVICSSWDRAVHVISDPETYPSFHYPDNLFRHAWNADYATSDPTFIAFNSQSSTVSFSKFGWKSTNGGAAWTAFPTSPGATGTIPLQSGGDWGNHIGGSIACASPTNIVCVPAGDSLPWYTKDGGTTWTEILISGVPTTGATGFGYTYQSPMDCAAADRVAANTFYLYNYITAKCYRSTNSGDSWTAMNSTNIVTNSAFGALKSVPGQQGHLFLVPGNQSGLGVANPGSQSMLRSTDGGATWAEIPGHTFREVRCIGFGKNAVGQTYPSILLSGWKDGVYGLWRSNDNCVTWSSIGTFPLGRLQMVISIDGSKEVYGTWYAAIYGVSYFYRTEAMQ
jgi:hypothetical protein